MIESSRRALLTGGAIVGVLALTPLLPAMCTMRRNEGIRDGIAGSPPNRPQGVPRPMLEEDIGPTLARLETWYAAHLSSDRYAFNGPATAAELDAFERQVGVELPGAYRQLYRWHDGDRGDDRWGHIYGLPLLSLDQAASQWRSWNDVLAGFGGNRYAIPAGAWPAGAVDPAYINRRWIPLTHDGSGNHIGLDFDPWPAGRIGQVILYGRDEDVKAVLAESLGQFLDWIADLLESGNFRLEAEADELPLLRLFRLKTPAIGFHDGARKLRGAPGPFL